MANYVYHRTDKLSEGGGTAILVRHDIDHHAAFVKDQEHLEATAIQVMLTSKPVNIPLGYLSPSRSVIKLDLSALVAVFPSKWRAN
jgi:hypothetical protein